MEGRRKEGKEGGRKARMKKINEEGREIERKGEAIQVNQAENSRGEAVWPYVSEYAVSEYPNNTGRIFTLIAMP